MERIYGGENIGLLWSELPPFKIDCYSIATAT